MHLLIRADLETGPEIEILTTVKLSVDGENLGFKKFITLNDALVQLKADIFDIIHGGKRKCLSKPE